MKAIINNSIDITNFITNVTCSEDIQSPTRTLKISVVVSDTDKMLPKISINKGDKIDFYIDNILFFSGIFLDKTKSHSKNTMDITFVDIGFKLAKNKAAYNFSNTTPEAIAKKICGDFNIATGDIANTGVNIPKLIVKDSLYDTLVKAYTKAYENTGKKYNVLSINNKIHIVEAGYLCVSEAIEEGKNLIDAEYSESIANMVNSIQILDGTTKNNVSGVGGSNGVPITMDVPDFNTTAQKKVYLSDKIDSLQGDTKQIKSYINNLSLNFSDPNIVYQYILNYLKKVHSVVKNIKIPVNTKIDNKYAMQAPQSTADKIQLAMDNYNSQYLNIVNYMDSWLADYEKSLLISLTSDQQKVKSKFISDIKSILPNKIDNLFERWEDTSTTSFSYSDNFGGSPDLDFNFGSGSSGSSEEEEIKIIDTVKNQNSIDSYGIFQDIYTTQEGIDNTTAARNLLHGEDKIGKITALGNVYCRAGFSVLVKDSYTGMYAIFQITSSTHTWNNAEYKMELDLSFDTVMDEKKYKIAKKKTKDSSSNIGIDPAILKMAEEG